MLLFRQDTSTDASGTYLVWTARSGHRYYTDPQTVRGPLPTNGDVSISDLFSGDGSNGSDRDRATAWVLNRTDFQSGIVWTGLAQLALMLVVFGALFSRKPLNGTRWFWFWVINLPLGIAVVCYAVSEHLHDSTPFAIPRRGGQGFLQGVAGIAFIPLTVTVLQQLVNRI